MENQIAVRLWAQDFAITHRYGETVTQREHSEPERKLMRAVLKDAISIYRKNLSWRNIRFKEVERWLFEEDNDRLFSFEMICYVLGLSPQRICDALVGWKASGRAAMENRTQ